MNIFFGLLGISFAFLLVKFRRQVLNFTGPGPWSFTDRFLGPGHSNLALILFAAFIFFFSIAYMTGAFETVFDANVADLAVKEQKK